MRAAIFWSPCPARRLRADPDRGYSAIATAYPGLGFEARDYGFTDLATGQRRRNGRSLITVGQGFILPFTVL